MLSRELRALARAPSSWLTVALGALGSGLALGRVPPGAPVADAVAAIFAGLSLALVAAFPLVAARAFARDRQSRADLLLAQLGTTTARTTAPRVLALLLAFGVIALPAATAAAALAATGARIDAGLVVSALLGHALFALVVVGTSALAAALTSSVANARLVALVAAVVPWLHERGGGAGSAFMPSAAVRVFERGVVDGRDVLALAVGGLGLCALAAVLASLAPLEKRALRAGVVVLVMLAAHAGAARVRWSVDVTGDRQSSLSASARAALGLVGDPIRATVGARSDEPAFADLQRAVLVPVARAAELRVRHDPSLDDDVIVWQVGARKKASRARTLPEVVPLVLELAGVKAPLVVDERPPPARLPGAPPVLVWGLGLLLLWPLVALGVLAALALSRRPRGS